MSCPDIPAIGRFIGYEIGPEDSNGLAGSWILRVAPYGNTKQSLSADCLVLFEFNEALVETEAALFLLGPVLISFCKLS